MSSESLLRGTSSELKVVIDELGVHLNEQVEEEHSNSYSCFQTPSGRNRAQQLIPYRDVLWCEEVSSGFTEITYALEKNKQVYVKTCRFALEQYSTDQSQSWAQRVMMSAYPNNLPQPRVLVVLNNHGGQGKARKFYQDHVLPVLQGARVPFTYMETKYSQHATKIAEELDISNFDIIACCSGDGVPHEIMNGFYKRQDRIQAFEKVAITQIPCGSGNALSLSSYGTNNAGLATVKMLKLVRSQMDLMAVTQKGSTKLSFLSQSYGAIADSDIGTEHLRWMGSIRFELGVLQKVLTGASYPCDLYVKYALKGNEEIEGHFDKHESSTHSQRKVNFELLHGDLNSSIPSDWVKLPSEETKKLGIFYVGKMPYVLSDAQFFPAAIPDDGYMDMIVTSIKGSLFHTAKTLLSVENGGHVHARGVQHAKISAYRLVPKISGGNHFISIDGEEFPFEPLQVEIVQGALTLLLENGRFAETNYGSEKRNNSSK